jgi:hypothetical protein
MPFSPEQARQTRFDQDKLWVALDSMEPDFDHEDKDVYTLAAEAIEMSGVLRAQKRDLEYRLDAQRETNRELCLIDNVGRVVHDLEVANGHIEYYRSYTQQLLEERAMLRRALHMIRRVSRICANPWVFPCKIIDKLVTGVFNGEFDD